MTKAKRSSVLALVRSLRILAIIGVGSLWLLSSPAPARAGYTAVASVNWGSDTTIGCSTNCNSSSVQGAFQSALGISGEKVTISGATADSSYAADGNVVGTVNSSGTVTSYTLANYTTTGTGSLNTFLQNNSDGNPPSNSIEIHFSTALPTNIVAISFDYEIFPDVSCQSVYVSSSNPGSCGGKGNPDLPSINLTDTSSKSSTQNMIFQRYAVVPGTNLGTIDASCTGVTGQTNCGGPGSSTVATTYTHRYNGTVNSSAAGDVTDHSKTSGASSAELAPQLLGTSGIVALNLSAGSGLTSLTFNDWPATIAISQIVFYKAPEPGSIALLASALMIGFVLKRRTKKRSTALG